MIRTILLTIMLLVIPIGVKGQVEQTVVCYQYKWITDRLGNDGFKIAEQSILPDNTFMELWRNRTHFMLVGVSRDRMAGCTIYMGVILNREEGA